MVSNSSSEVNRFFFFSLLLETQNKWHNCAKFPPKKSIFLCFLAKHASFDINSKNRLIANRLCERRFFA
jgi:hypothetical protein